ncbi:MAG: nitroreductase family protein [Salibacteraceae bacterium]
MSKQRGFIPFKQTSFSQPEMMKRAEALYQFSNQRRSIRDFSDKDVPFEVIKNIVLTAGTSPSGAHKQPWTFCIIRSNELKSKIKTAAEEEEYKSYHGRMSEQWLEDLKTFGTDWNKPFIETAPWIIVVFKRIFEFEENEKRPNYYVNESVGIACGLLINAIHNAGLATLTHTPSPMNFLTEILERPENEKPYLLLPIGYAARDAKVPNIDRKTFEEVAILFD